MEGGTRNKLQQGIEKGFVLVNEKPVKSNYKIKPGDHVLMYSDTSPDSTEIIPEPLDLEYYSRGRRYHCHQQTARVCSASRLRKL